MARNLTAQSRVGIGKNNNNRLREKGFIPAIMYSHGKSENIQVNKKEFGVVFGNNISASVIIDLDISGKDKCHVFVKEYQKDPVTDEVVHLDFYKITEGEKIKTSVPLEIQGTSIGSRLGGLFEVIDRALHVECLPSELPEKITIDVTNLNIGEAIHIKDIKGPASMKFLMDADHVVAHVTTMKEEEEKPAEVAAESAVAAAPAPEAKKE